MTGLENFANSNKKTQIIASGSFKCPSKYCYSPILVAFCFFISFLSTTQGYSQQLASSSSSNNFDYRPISRTKNDSCADLLALDQAKRLAVKKLTKYCNEQNKVLSDNGYPTCPDGTCFSQLSKGASKATPVELKLSNQTFGANVFIGFVVYLTPKKTLSSLSCKTPNLAGPYSLDRLEQLRDYLDYLQNLEKCRSQKSLAK